VRQQQDKLFYVSPFIEMAMRYHFRVSLIGRRGQIGAFSKPTATGRYWRQRFIGPAAAPWPRRGLLRAFFLRCLS